MLLIQASYFSKKGDLQNSDILLNKAVELYSEAPFKIELIPTYKKRIERLQNADKFKNSFLSSMPYKVRKKNLAEENWSRFKI